MTRLSICLFGPFRVSLDGQPVTTFESDKVRALLAYLAVESDRPHRREKLAGLFWPDHTEASARDNLSHSLSKLRQAVGDVQADPPTLLISRQTIQLNPECGAWVDVTVFDDLAGQDLPALEQAVPLYRGPFLEGFSLPGCPEFEAWALLEAEHRQRLALDALHRLADGLAERGEAGRALAYAWRQIEIDPSSESAHRQAMRLLARSGQRDAALALYETCRRRLAEELGAEVSAETIRLYERIREGKLPAAREPRHELEVPAAAPPGFLTGRPAAAAQAVFVARDQELAWLEGLLQAAVAGRGQAAFVVGGPGRGKTALLHEFARRALDAQPDLLLGMGTCNAYSGVGDPYLPFRGVLAMLTGDAEAAWAAGTLAAHQARRMWDALPEVAPVLAQRGAGLVGTLLPGRELLGRARAVAARGAEWLHPLELLRSTASAVADPQANPAGGLEQSHLFEQYANVLLDLSTRHPLLLVLDDLQWADLASTALLFHLGRRLERGRILLTGAYRPHELAVGRDGERHPLEPALAEFRARFGDAWLDLAATDEAEGRTFVDRFLDSEPNALDERFRSALFGRTRGHPLFTVELFRAMQGRGDLVRDGAGRWAEGASLEWGALPARAEAAIAERIDRLPEELRQVLAVASVEGEEFAAQTVAIVQGVDELGILRTLRRELAVRHRLVRAQGERAVDGRSLSLYRFTHFLFQQHLYQGLGDGERRLLHRRVGEALEQLYTGRLEDAAVQLAHHFAGDPERERRYLRMAGERAAAQYANEQAVEYLSRALEMTPGEETDDRYAALLAREKVYDVLGSRELQKQDLAALKNLAAALSDGRRQAEVALRQAKHALATGDYATAKTLAQTAAELAQKAGDVRGAAEGHLQWGRVLWLEGDGRSSQTQLQEALTIARSAGLRQIEAGSLLSLGTVHSYAGANRADFAGARLCCEQALTIYREIGDRRGEGTSLHNLGDLIGKEDPYQAGIWYEQAVSIARDIGDRGLECGLLYEIGRTLRRQGAYREAQAYAERALLTSREVGDRRFEGAAFMELGEVCYVQGDYAAARVHYEQALLIFCGIGYALGEAWAACALAYALHKLGIYGEARACGQRALLLRQRIGNREGECVSLVQLGIICRSIGDCDGARAFLEPAFQIARELDDRWGELWVLKEWALLSHQVGNEQAARDFCRQTLEMIQYLDPRCDQSIVHVRGCALTVLGHALAAQGCRDEASDAYTQAATVWRDLNLPHRASEPLAGLARVSLAQGDLAQAQSQVSQVLEILASGTLDGTEQPFRVYLTCHQVLSAAGDPRAAEILARGHAELQEWAARCPDEETRRSFLENVPWHQEIVREWQAAQAGPGG